MAVSKPSYQLIVGGTDYSGYLEHDTWSVTQNFGRQGTTARFQLMDDWSTRTPAVPQVNIKPLSELTFLDTSTGALLFAGYVTTPNLTSYNPTTNEWLLDCVDYTLRADNIIVFEDLYNLTADAMIVKIVHDAPLANLNAATVANGGYIYPGPIIGRLQFPYTTMSNALTKIARLSSQQTDYAWFIDYNRNVNFFSLAQTPAPTTIFSDDPVALNTQEIDQSFGPYKGGYNQFMYLFDGATVRNSCIVRGSNLAKTITDKFVGNGSTNQWPLSFIVDSSVSSPKLIIDGVQTACVVVTQGQSFTGTGWIITQNAIGTWILQGVGKLPHKGSVISITYTSTSPIITRQDNGQSQQAYADSRGLGVYQSFISDPTLTTLSAAASRAQGELQEYQWVQERVTLTTSEAWPGHIQAGQTFQLVSSRVPNSQNGNALGIRLSDNAIYLVVQCAIKGEQGQFRTYTITGTRVS
jgi:hypothetical protein